MKKLYSREQGVHYFYKGHIICKETERDNERRYSFRVIGSGYEDAGYARTLELCKLHIG